MLAMTMSMKVTIILLLTMVVLLQSSLSCPMVSGTGRKGSVAVAQLLDDCPSRPHSQAGQLQSGCQLKILFSVYPKGLINKQLTSR